MRKLTWIIFKRVAAQFTFIFTWVKMASYNALDFVMNVVYFSLQMFLMNIKFCH